MKRIISLICFALISVLLISLLISAPALASSATGKPVLSLTETDVFQGDVFTSTLSFEKGAKISRATLFFNYDPEIVELVSCVPNEDSIVSPEINTDVVGQISIAFSVGYNISANLPLADITFALKDDLSEGNYSFLELIESRSFVGRLNSDNIVENIEFDYNAHDLKIFQAGDINLDGKVDGIDAVYILRYESGLQSGREGASFYLPYYSDPAQYDNHQKYMLNVADAYFDGEVNGSDAVSILRHEVGYDELLGNRVAIRFYDIENNLYTKRSVIFGTDLTRIPPVPEVSGYATGSWSSQRNSYVAPNFSNLETNIDVFAFYGQQVSEAMDYYKRTLTARYYSDDLQNNLSNDLNLVTSLFYQGEYRATIAWTSSNNATLNASGDGKFSRPTYNETVSLTALITSYKGEVIEMEDSITFDYNVIGVFQAPRKSEVEEWLTNFFKDGINYELKLPKKLTNKELASESAYELRIEWDIDDNGVENPISVITRTNTSKYIDLIAHVYFNGQPLEDDGRIDFENIHVEAITEMEIRAYVIDKIAANMGLTVTNNETFWHDQTPYSTTIKWVSKNSDIAVIANNTISIHNTAVNGTLLPLSAQVTYNDDEGAHTFEIEYTVSVVTENTTLVPGVNIDPALYDALKDATDTYGNLTTEALKDNRFVYLDLSGYPDITDLTGLSYCKNLHVLNISGLHVTRGMNEIATLNKLEAFIARGCGLSNLTDGGVPVLKNAINLEMVDLSCNNFTSLDSVFAEGVMYGKLYEMYLNDNNIQDISTLSKAPALCVLALSNNGLTSDKITPIGGFKYLTYLSLSNNDIDDISALKNLTRLQELRLQNNRISDVRDLKKLTKLVALYLGNNQIRTNIDFLDYLTELRVLYLNDNLIEDISQLVSLEHLESINVSGNKINSLSILESYSGTLKEVYAERNEIASFSFVRNMVNLRVLMLSNNLSIKESSLTSYLVNLTKLETLCLSGKPISDLSFIEGMDKLIRLDIADCKIPSYLIKSSQIITESNGIQILEISDYQDNIASILGRKSTLLFLDISDNNLAYSTNEMVQYMAEEQGIVVNVSTFSFTGNYPKAFSELYELNKLVVLYANNTNKVIDGNAFTQLMTDLKYIAFENSHIDSITWLSRLRNLVYVDLANNYITAVDLGTNISARSKETLQYLYLDTLANDASFAKAYVSFDENVLKELSLEGITVGSMDKLPYMDQLEYLNISNTGITNLQGTDPDFYDTQSILRFTELRVLDVSHLDADITCLNECENLEKLFAVADVEETLFFNNALTTLYDLYNDGVECYLYDKETPYEPVASVEGTLILDRIEDFSCDIRVAADKVISDNNPYIVPSMNDFELNWSVSNAVNYEIKNDYIAVKDYTNIDDETLSVTASILVYPDQSPVTRTFTVNTSILRPTSVYYNYNKTGLKDYMRRLEPFTYAVIIKAASTEGFSSAVKPVVDDIKYSYACVLANGQPGVYTNIFTNDADNGHTIKANAPLNSVSTITAKIGHNKNNNFVQDDSVSISFTVTGRTFTATYHLNDGTLLNSDNESITSQELPEEAEMFKNLTLSRAGYLFDGWYTDSALTQLFCAAGATAYMPCNDVDLYAKWKPHYYTLVFNANGGTVSETERTVYCDTPIGTLPTPTRTGYTFDGWYTQATGGTLVTADTAYVTTETVTLYAHWSAIYVTSLEIVTPATTRTFYVGDTFSSAGLVVKATYNDGTTANVSCTVSSPNMTTAGTKTVTVSYGGKSTSYTITVNALTISISINASTASSGYMTVNVTAPRGTITYSSNNTNVATVNSSGRVTLAGGTGSTTITATANNNGCTVSASKTITISNTSGTKYKETSTSTSSSVYYASQPDGYKTTMVLLSGNTIPTYSTNLADYTGSSSNTSTGRVDINYTESGTYGYVYYQWHYSATPTASTASNIYRIINYKQGNRNVQGTTYPFNNSLQFFSTTDYREHGGNTGGGSNQTGYAPRWAYEDTKIGHPWYVAEGIQGTNGEYAYSACWYRFPIQQYTKTTTTYTYYYYTIS